MKQMDWATTEITAIKDDLADLRYDIESANAGLQCQIDVVNMEIDELRPVTGAKTENPNQKGDLEISNRIEVNPFLSSFIDLDSEEYLQQRPLWDFTVDF